MAPAPSLRSSQTAELHIAGIGASAGGLEAMLPMFAQMRPTGRVAYVVAQHMAHNGHSDLVARLIGRESALPVMLAGDTEELQADTVYVIPAGRDGRVTGRTLSLHAPGAGNISTPSINTLFTSIAESGRRNAIGIVLSGTGFDGVAGCRVLKALGGLTIAQEPAEAKYDGMPGAAVDAGVVDKVLPADKIGGALAELFPGSVAAPRAPSPSTQVSAPALSHVSAPVPPWIPTPAVPPLSSASSPVPSKHTAAEIDSVISEAQRRNLEHLLQQVHQATQIDFSSYKEDTLLRRLEKRKSMLGMVNDDQYLAHIRRHPEELHALQHLFLVSVSSFFRDRASFSELEQALAGIVATKSDGEPIRVWVPGCASGEEPYSLAIMLTELLGKCRGTHAVNIIGTDLNPEALEMARAGLYRQTAFKETEAALRQRYFVARGQHFEIAQDLRNLVQFEQRDVLSGAPAGGLLDLVSCRNLLIYMKSHLQDQLIKSFHQSLRAQGLLFIGQSESLSFTGNALFAPIDHYHRLFRRRH